MLRHTSIIAAFALVATLCIAPARAETEVDQSTNAWRALIGSWQVTSAQTSLILSIEPGREVLVLWVRPGSHSMQRTSWETLPGGILVHGIPRIRLWTGRDKRSNELRAELEAIPELDFDPNDDFHDHFFMRRIEYEAVPPQWFVRPIPERWKRETLDEDWNETAGRNPLPENIRDAEPDESTVPPKAAPSAFSDVPRLPTIWRLEE